MRGWELGGWGGEGAREKWREGGRNGEREGGKERGKEGRYEGWNSTVPFTFLGQM